MNLSVIHDYPDTFGRIMNFSRLQNPYKAKVYNGKHFIRLPVLPIGNDLLSL